MTAGEFVLSTVRCFLSRETVLLLETKEERELLQLLSPVPKESIKNWTPVSKKNTKSSPGRATGKQRRAPSFPAHARAAPATRRLAAAP